MPITIVSFQKKSLGAKNPRGREKEEKRSKKKREKRSEKKERKEVGKEE